MSDLALQLDKIAEQALRYKNDATVADAVSKLTGLGSISRAQSNVFRGVNHRGTGSPINTPQDNQGITFFTRPELNLTYDNVMEDRILTPLLNKEYASPGRAIRNLLDPTRHKVTGESPLTDERNPFMPILTNQLISASGYPDITLDTFVSDEGLYKESFSFVDSSYKTYSVFDLSLTFANQPGHPIIFLFMVWVIYMAKVYDGSMFPRIEKLIQNECDYNTAIYRLVLDPKREHVIHIAKTSAAFPTVNPIGSLFNFNNQSPLNGDVNEISMSLKCMGVEYDDPILMLEFNRCVAELNPQLATSSRDIYYVKLTKSEEQLYNYYGLPWINIAENHRLEWWVPRDTYRILKSNRY